MRRCDLLNDSSVKETCVSFRHSNNLVNYQLNLARCYLKNIIPYFCVPCISLPTVDGYATNFFNNDLHFL